MQACAAWSTTPALLDILPNLHDVDVLALSKVCKRVLRSVMAHCMIGCGPIIVTEEGFAGLWKVLELWEVYLYLEDLNHGGSAFARSVGGPGPLRFLSHHVLPDKRAVRLFASAAQNVMRDLSRTNSSRSVQLYFASFTFNVKRVREFLDQGGSELDYAMPHSPTVSIPELGINIALDLLGFGDSEDDSDEYRLELLPEDLEQAAERGIEELWMVSCLCAIGTFGINTVIHSDGGGYNDGSCAVQVGSVIDRAVRSGEPLPMILGIRSKTFPFRSSSPR